MRGWAPRRFGLLLAALASLPGLPATAAPSLAGRLTLFAYEVAGPIN